LQGLLDDGILLYLLQSRLVKDIFVDFPGGPAK
jgi:hypothetical protein